ncbi:MAG: TlpA disulfide reductase family protein [Candidatus Promineifilaceae bacterium]|nr:TlpA disulfide reductase family protein [Candidatus Promineifilaceae bacterium]
MIKSRFEWSILILIVLLMGAAWIYDSRESGTEPQNFLLTEAPIVGHFAPDFTASTPDGEAFSLTEFVNREGDGGQPVVLNFWASWCGPCRIEVPHFERVSLAYNGRAAILGVNQAESVDTITQFQQNTHITYPLLVDQDMEINRKYQVANLPTTIFIDANGIIREVFVGTMNQAVLEDRLEGLLDS